MRTHVPSSGHDGTHTVTTKHIPVLLQPVLEMLAVDAGGTYLDGTLGGGGHAAEIIKQMSPAGTFIGIDKDEHILSQTAAELGERYAGSTAPELIFKVGGFEDAAQLCADAGIYTLDGALLDLGWGSHTLESGRGFSFQKNEPLLMTYGTPTEGAVTAYEIVNTWSYDTLVAIFQGWGEERRSRQAAEAIVDARLVAPIDTTGQLCKILERVIPRMGKVHPATRIFQALRIAVNRELEILTPACEGLYTLLTEGGRLCIITFHSGEDRIIKQLFNLWEDEGKGRHLTSKVIQPTRDEAKTNPRARSAKLRVFEKSSAGTTQTHL
jgi:16S rRNA (cytosine1402-N4)-methyltransferase